MAPHDTTWHPIYSAYVLRLPWELLLSSGLGKVDASIAKRQLHHGVFDEEMQR